MQIILKKYKITNSLLKQATLVDIEKIDTLKCLGWCIYLKTKHFVFYDETKHLIYKCVELKEVILKSSFERTTEDKPHEKHYNLTVLLPKNFYHRELFFGADKNKALSMKKDIEKAIKKQNELGQFYI
ncbi:hypothetical protein [Algoriella sp.]|uniref:hypothetical protein n=1 Tax=Algoriella sp. TaxID=1872434 RepID=UPI002FC59B84